MRDAVRWLNVVVLRRSFIAAAWIGVTLLLRTCLAGAAEQKPNILWVTGEGMSARWLGCYGNQQIRNPIADDQAEPAASSNE